MHRTFTRPRTLALVVALFVISTSLALITVRSAGAVGQDDTLSSFDSPPVAMQLTSVLETLDAVPWTGQAASPRIRRVNNVNVVEIRITDAGFSAAEIDVAGPTDVVWHNDRTVPVTLRSGGPVVSPGSTIYLPNLDRSSDGLPARVVPRIGLGTIDFSVVLGPGESFMQRYTEPDVYHFHLAGFYSDGRPQPTGRLTLTGTQLLSSSPRNGEGGVAVTRETIFLFSSPLDPSTVSQESFVLQTLGVEPDYRVHLSADGRRVTLFYAAPLPGSSRVRVNVDGDVLRDSAGDAIDLQGNGVTGGMHTVEFDTLALTVVPGTRVCGRVFASELAVVANEISTNTPLAGATITVDGREDTLRAVTDNDGNFCLDPAPAGEFFVHIDGRTATNGVPAGAYYPFVGKSWHSVPGTEASVGDVYLPLVYPGTLQPVSQAEDVTINFPPAVLEQFPEFGDVAITVPAGSLFFDDGTPGTQAGIAPVPPDRLPGPLPPDLEFPLVITVQTDGATNFDTPAPVCFPNLPLGATGAPLAPGEKSALWSFNHDTGRFAVVGPMTATEDGRLVCTDPGVGIPAPGWHAAWPGVPGCCGPIRRGGGPRPPTGPPVEEPDEEEEEEECKPDTPGAQCKQKEDYTPSVNGCGPQWLIDVTGPQPIYNDPMGTLGFSCSLEPACNTHDQAYGQCGGDKLLADADFLADMEGLCGQCFPGLNPANVALRVQCLAFASSFFGAVHEFGGSPYADAQDSACDCTCEDRAGMAEAAPPFFQEFDFGRLGESAATPIRGAEAAQDDEETVSLGRHYYALVNADTGLVQRGTAGSTGVAFERDIVLAPNTYYRVFILSGEDLAEGYTSFITPNTGETFEMPPIYLMESLGWDLDNDRLGALGEFVMGTDPLNADTDGDGVLDGAEVQQGTDPAEGTLTQTGIIGTAETAGPAIDVCVMGEVAVVAEAGRGLSVFNVFRGMPPAAVGYVELPEGPTRLACAQQRALVLTESAQMFIVDVSAPSQPALVHTSGFGGAGPTAVVADGRFAYVGLDDGRVVRVVVDTGTVDATVTLTPSDALKDLAIVGDYLYGLAFGQQAGMLHAMPLNPLGPGTATLFEQAGELFHPARLHGVPNGLMATRVFGFTTFDLMLPTMPSIYPYEVLGGLGWNEVLPTGGDLGIVLVGPTPERDTDHNVSLYDISDPTVNDDFLIEFPTPGIAYGGALARGLVYVADGTEGLHVLAYLAEDTDGMAPSVELLSNFAPGRAEADAYMRLTAQAVDDVQVRDVEFYVNGEMVARVDAYPFEYRFTTPAGADPMVVQARATDTGGNVGWSDVQTRTVVADATPPLPVAVVPAQDGYAEMLTQVQVVFDGPVQPGTLTTQSFYLRQAGPDEVYGTADDVIVEGASVEYAPDSFTATLHFESPLPSGRYRAELLPAITDPAGNNLLRTYHWQFRTALFIDEGFVSLAPSDLEEFDGFGYAVAIDGDWMVVGAREQSVNGLERRGTVYLFTRDATESTGWREVKKLDYSDAASFDQFGSAVAIHGDTIVVGAPFKRVEEGASGSGSQRGSIYIFQRNAGGADNWGEVARFSEPVANFSNFGHSVAVQGDLIVAGARGSGQAFLFGRSGAGATDWALIKPLLPDGGGTHREFGEAVAIDAQGRWLAVGASGAGVTEPLLRQGAVYIYERDEGGEGNWGFTARLTSLPSVFMGIEVALYGDLLAVGSNDSSSTPDAEFNAGTVHLFIRDEEEESGWRELPRIFDPAAPDFLNFGRSIAIGDGVMFVGAYGYPTPEGIEIGAVYPWQSEGGLAGPWINLDVWPVDAPGTRALGWDMALEGDLLVVGAHRSNQEQGAVYLFDVSALVNSE